jgi:transposase-like protein
VRRAHAEIKFEQSKNSKETRHMDNDTLIELSSKGIDDPLTELLRSGARDLIAQAVNAELVEVMKAFANEKTDGGRARVVRSGYQPKREILTGIGAVEVKVPKIRARQGETACFNSALVPPYVRKSKSIEAAIPWLYLKGISTGQMQEALEALLGSEAKGLSANVVGRLKSTWEQEYKAWVKRRITGQWVYIWADGIYSSLKADDGRLCCLVVIGVNTYGEKHFLAIEDGVRESTQSWREVLLSLKQRGLTEAPKLAVGDGALGFWGAISEVYPETTHQRCWMHKTGNVLNYLPKQAQPKAKECLHNIWMSETKEEAYKAFDDFTRRYEAKYPKATGCLAKDKQELLAFYDFPAEHWAHIRTTNVIESCFATLRHRSKQTRGCVTRVTMLSMIYKLSECATSGFHKLRGFRQLGKVIEGVIFKNGIEVVKEGRTAA